MSETQHTRSLQRCLLALSLLMVATLAVLNSVVSPLFEPPDELQHYQFVRYLIDERNLPVQEADSQVSQSHQPPLYYWGGALLVAGLVDPQTLPGRNPFWAYDRASEVSQDNKLQFLDSPVYAFPYQGTALVMHMLRFWSVLLALGTVLATWQLGQVLWPDDPAKVGLMLTLFALNPMFLYIAGAVNNDNMIMLWGAVLLWLAASALRNGFTWRLTISIGLVWAAALLSKLTGVVLIIPWGFALLWEAWRKRSFRFLASRLAVILVISVGLTGWWFARNFQIYGDPLALNIVLDVWGARTAEQKALAFLWPDVIYSWTNFWGRFGYGQVPLPGLIYDFFLALSALALAGGARWLARGGAGASLRRPIWLALAGTSAAFVGALAYYIFQNPTGANGRYLFPALPALAALMTAGLSVWVDSRQRPTFAYVSLMLPVAAVAIYTAAGFLPWTYARPELLSQSEASTHIQHPANVVFGESIVLLGTTAGPQPVVAGTTLELMACWQARQTMSTNYSLFVRLLDHEFHSLGQRDTYPGLGRFPTSFWRPGDRFCDTYPIHVTDSLRLPAAAKIEIGFYDLETGAALPVTTESGQPVTQVIVEQVKVVPATPAKAPEAEHRLDAQFEQGVSLVGYQWSAAEMTQNDTVSVMLFWRASGALDRSYTIFAQLLDVNGQLITQDDGLPRDGAYPTDFWGKGELIVDSRHFVLPAETKPGPTTLYVGFYLLEDLGRLPRSPGAEHSDWVEVAGPIIVED